MDNKTIQVFEYEFLHVGQYGFDDQHMAALAKYNDTYEGKFFTLHYQAVRFQQFVGVIQVGELTIEILPKIGRENDNGGNKDIWQGVLIDMLNECHWMKIHAHEKASLQLKHNNILDAYLELFIKECESIIHQGLVKKYRQEEGNVNALKGKLLFSKNIQQNLVHQERFYTRHQVYDRNNIFNQLLLKALKLIPVISQNPLLKDRVYSLLLDFPELDDIIVNEHTFEKLVFDRKTSAYKEAIEIAAMLLLNFRPDVSSGYNHVLAILFDMNKLWEEYVYRQIIRHNTYGWNILPQEYQNVWRKSNLTQSKGVKPDIVIRKGQQTLIIDTKWKLPEDDIPADGDLKQMFMYNEYWEGANAVLFYPKAKSTHSINGISYDSGEFVPGGRIPNPTEGYRHKCGVMKACVLDEENKLDTQFGFNINESILHEFKL